MKLRSLALIATLGGCGSSDSPSTVTVSDAVVPAGEEGDVVITLRRDGGSGALRIPFTTRADTASEDADFALKTSEVVWDDDETGEKTITISLLDDVTVEPSESFVVELGEPSNDSTIDRTTVPITIADDDHEGDSYALTTNGRLMHFDRAEPGRFTWAAEITGLPAGEALVAIDTRPADGTLYGLSDAAKLYRIDPTSGVATVASTLVADPSDTSSPFTALSGDIGIDFNPITDRLRVTSTTGQNLRVDVDTGRVITDPAITGQSTGYTAIAHNNNIAAACRTRLYAIDVTGNRFVTQSPNEGTTQGAGGLKLTPSASGGFDIYTDAEGKSAPHAILTVDGTPGMYKIDLGTGQATLVRKASPLVQGERVKAFAFSTLPADVAATQQLGEMFGVTATEVVSFNRADPEKMCTAKPLTGLDANETVLDVDMRPSNGSLYVLTRTGSTGKVRRVDPYSGNLTPAVTIAVPLSGTTFGIDFSPPDNAPLRIVSNTGQNLRVTDLETGAATADATGAAATGAAYTDSLYGAGTATLYVIDPATDRLAIQNPSTGALTDVGPLGVNITMLAGFDIDGRNNAGYLASTTGTTTHLRTIDIATGAVSAPLGTVGTSSPLVGLTRATPEVNLYGVTTEGKLVRISLADPANVTVVSDPMAMPPTDKLTGLAPGEHFVSVDFKPGQNMYGLTNFGGVFVINSSTAGTGKQGVLAADPMDSSSPFSALAGTAFDIDFDPLGDQPLRIVSDAEQNLRIPVLAPPKVFTDAPLTAASSVDIAGSAYTNSYAGATSSRLYAICATSGTLLAESTRDTGNLTTVGALGVRGTITGFDIAGGNNGIALVALQLQGETINRLYRVNLATGVATQIGNGIGGAPVRSIAVQVR